MSTCVRLVMPEDREQLRGLARRCVAESEPGLGFDDAVFDETIETALQGRDLTGFVAERDERLVGFILCAIQGFFFTTGIMALLRIIYVEPGCRGTRVPAVLFMQFLQWGEIVGAKRYLMGIGNSLHPDRTARFFERFGARRVGYEMVIG